MHDAGEPFDVTDATGDVRHRDVCRPGHVPRSIRSSSPTGRRLILHVGGHVVTIGQRGDVVTGVDFGNLPLPGGVSGVKWNDLDGDGVRIRMNRACRACTSTPTWTTTAPSAIGEPAAITAADGSYVINDIPAGIVSDSRSAEPGWTLTYPALGYHLVDVAARQ